MTKKIAEPFKSFDGHATSPRGFRAAGVAAGIKSAGKDLALLVSDPVATVAGVFTSNRLPAAPVRLCREHLAGRRAKAVVINSGNANACTGAQGLEDARHAARHAAGRLGVAEEQVFVCSTGMIGVNLPMPKIVAGIDAASAGLSAEGGRDASEAIMTTDHAPKRFAAKLTVDGAAVTVGAMAKGAGMIEPNMATMLAFLTTDAAVDAQALQRCLSAAAAQSFNRICVDASESTNDTVLFLANGAAANRPLDEAHPDWGAFCAAVNAMTLHLALEIVRDGEGATKVVHLEVTGAASEDDARRAARSVAHSILVRTSWAGSDPNWGRVVDALGYSGAAVQEDRITVRYDDEIALRDGRCDRSHTAAWERVVRRDSFRLRIDLGQGEGRYAMYACDCNETYVKINSEYST